MANKRVFDSAFIAYIAIVLVLLVVALLVSGCSFLRPDPEVRYVDVPAPVSCVTWEPDAPVSKFSIIDPNAPLWEQEKALLFDRESDKNYILGLQDVINGCK